MTCKKESFIRKTKLKMIFVSRFDKNLSQRQLIELSCSSILHLYKLNLYRRNRATLKHWEDQKSLKEFYSAENLEKLEETIEICKF